MTIEGNYTLFAHLETVYLGSMARRSLIMRNVSEVVERPGQADLLLPARQRPLAVQTGDGWSAHVPRDRRLHRRAASWWGGRGIGTVPHALIAATGEHGHGRGQVRGAYHHDMNITVLVDFENDSVRTALEVAHALGDQLWGVRLDTSESLVDRSLLEELDPPGGSFTRTGVNPRLVEKVRGGLDGAGFGNVKIVVSADSPRRGSASSRRPMWRWTPTVWLLADRGQNDFTLTSSCWTADRAPRPARLAHPRLERGAVAGGQPGVQ